LSESDKIINILLKNISYTHIYTYTHIYIIYNVYSEDKYVKYTQPKTRRYSKTNRVLPLRYISMFFGKRIIEERTILINYTGSRIILFAHAARLDKPDENCRYFFCFLFLQNSRKSQTKLDDLSTRSHKRNMSRNKSRLRRRRCLRS